MTDREIETKLTEILVEMYELDPAEINAGARLYEDLGLDSIDAVDLIVRLKELTGAVIEPERVKELRTVGSVVELVAELLRVR